MRRTAVLTVLAHLALVAAAPAQATLSAQEVRSALARFDAAFNARDLDACARLFSSENDMIVGLMRDRLAAAFASPTRIEQVSQLEGEPWQVGPRTVARVRHERRAVSKSDAEPVVEWCFFAFRSDSDGAVPVMAVELHPRMMNHLDAGRFTCRPCNYSVGGIEGWLPVPLPPERANAMEAVSFYLLGTDVSFDASVHIEPAPGKARPALESLVADCREMIPDVEVEFLGEWTPPSLSGVADHGMDGEQVRLRTPDGREQWLFLGTMGVMRYLLVAQGSGPALRRRQADIRAMLESFELEDPGISMERLATDPLRAHTGGQLGDDHTYVNTRHDFEFSGPTGWASGQRSGPFLFQVHYSCPEGDAGLWMTGYRNRGADQEQRARVADRRLADLCRKGGLSIAPGGDGGWQPAAAGGFHTRTVQTRADAGNDRPPFLFRLALRGDLLVVLSGYGSSDAQRKLVREAFDSLRAR